MSGAATITGLCSTSCTNLRSPLDVSSLITVKSPRLVLLCPPDEYSIIHACAAALSPFLNENVEIVLAESICGCSGKGSTIAECGIKPPGSSRSVTTLVTNYDEKQKGSIQRSMGRPAVCLDSTIPTVSTQSRLRLLSRIQELLRFHRRGESGIPLPPPQYVPGGIRVKEEDGIRRLSRVHLSGVGPSHNGNAAVTLRKGDLCLLVLDAQIRSDSPETERLQDVLVGLKSTEDGFVGTLIVLIDDEMFEKTEFMWNQNNCNATSWNSVAHNFTAYPPNAANGPHKVLVVRAPRFGPPSQEYALTEAAIESGMGLRGLLPTICAGIATGALRTSPIGPSTSCKLVPVDVAIHIALLCYHRLCHEEDSIFSVLSGKSSVPGLFSISIPTPVEDCIIWGKIGEFLVNYYQTSTNENAISSLFDGKAKEIFLSLTTRSPSLVFQPSFEGATMIARCPVTFLPFLDEKRSKSRKEELRSICSQSSSLINHNHVSDFLDSLETVWDLEMDSGRLKKWKRKLTTEEDSLSDIFSPVNVQVPSAQLFKKRKDQSSKALQNLPYPVKSHGFYLQTMSRMSFHPSLIPYTFYTSLGLVDWGMYIRVVARSVLAHLAKHFVASDLHSQIISSYAFPLPLREVMNFQRIKNSGFPLLSRCRASASFYIRTGIVPSGKLYSLTRGMSPQRLALILAQPSVQQMITAWSLHNGCSEEDAKKRAKRILLRIGDTLNDPQSRCLGTAVYHTFSRMYDKVEVNYEGFERLTCWTRLPRVQVVLIPSHRSYIDFMIMSLLTASMEISLPHIASGEDFLQMGPLASFMRGTGAFFIRRSFRNDPLYSLLFKEYVRQLVLHRQMMEFFIEGTRSRTGQTLQPKMGVLKCIVDAFLDGQNVVKDVLFVPISVSYDQILEAPLYAQELLGIPKPKETISNLIKGFSSLKQEYGSIRIHIAEAISLHALIAKCENTFSLSSQSPHSSRCAVDQSPFQKKLLFTGVSSTPPALLKILSSQIIGCIIKNTVITSTSIVAAALETCWRLLRVKNTPLTAIPLVDISVSIASIIQWIRDRHGKLSGDLFSCTQEEILTTGLRHLSSAVKVDKASATVMLVSPLEVSQMILHMSSNQLVPLFIQESVLTVVANGAGTLKESTAGEQCKTVKYEEMVLDSRFIRELFSEHFPSMTCDLSPSCAAKNASLSAEILHGPHRQEIDEHEKWVQSHYGSFLRSHHSQKLAKQELPHGLVQSERNSSSGSPESFFFPLGALFEFTSHLLFPHIDTMYVLVEGIVALFKEFMPPTSSASTPLPKKAVISSIHKTLKELFTEGYLVSCISCSLDSLSHHVECLLRMKILQATSGTATRDAPPVLFPGDNGTVEKMSQFASRWKKFQLRLVQRKSDLELRDFIHKSVVKKYMEVTHSSKL